MKSTGNSVSVVVSAVAAAGVLAGCAGHITGTSPGASAASAASGTAAPEDNPAGDIPDSQVFVPYTPATKLFTVSVPEGWAQTTKGGATSSPTNSMRCASRCNRRWCHLRRT